MSNPLAETGRIVREATRITPKALIAEIERLRSALAAVYSPMAEAFVPVRVLVEQPVDPRSLVLARAVAAHDRRRSSLDDYTHGLS